VLKDSKFAPEAQAEGSQTRNVWKNAQSFRALKVRHNLYRVFNAGMLG
jgi:hypothetical protein